MELLSQHIESLIFATEQPIPFQEIKDCLEKTFETKIETNIIEAAIMELMQRYEDEQFAFEIVEIAGGFQFMTKGAFHHTIANHLKLTMRKRLSRAALETLAIIAYRQPVTKSDLEAIRGVSCDYSVQKLLEKELIAIRGRSERPGRPLLYGTSDKFMDYFGIKELTDLPKPKDFKAPESEIGEAAPVEENIEISENKE